MKHIGQVLFEKLWLTLPCTALALFVIIICHVHIPIGAAAVHEGSRLYHHYGKKRDAADYPRRERLLRGEIALLDSGMRQIEARYLRQEGTLLEELYAYADSTGFQTEKVEAGSAQPAGDHRETSVSITGTGGYRSVGAFVERIENSHQSTRVGQLDIKARESGDPEVFLDVAIREETAGGGKGTGNGN